MSLLKLLASDSFITVNKELIKLLGLHEALILGELASEADYWQKNNGLTNDGYFYSTVENVESKTTLSEHYQRKALKKLKELGIIEYTRRDIPAKRYIRLNEGALIDLMNSSETKNSVTSSGRAKELDLDALSTNNNIDNNNINIKKSISELTVNEKKHIILDYKDHVSYNDIKSRYNLCESITKQKIDEFILETQFVGECSKKKLTRLDTYNTGDDLPVVKGVKQRSKAQIGPEIF